MSQPKRMSSSVLRTALAAKMNPVVTDDPAFLHQYGYALRVVASVAQRTGREHYGDLQRERAYYLRTLAR